MIFEPSARPSLSTDELAGGQCAHPAKWIKNGYDKRTGKPVRRCPLCGKREIVGKSFTRENVLASRLKFVPLWLQGIGAREAAQRLRVSYATVRSHYHAIRDLYLESTGELRRVDGRVNNNFTPEARVARLAVKPKVKAVGA